MLMALSAALTGCGEKDEAGQEATGEVKVRRESDLMPLRMRKLDRSDREMVSKAEGTDLGEGKPVAEVGWESERLSGQALARLKKLVNRKGQVGDVLAESFLGSVVIPGNLERKEDGASGREVWVMAGKTELVGAKEFEQGLENGLIGEVHLKVVGVRVGEDFVETDVFVELGSPNRQATAEWLCRWSLGENEVLRLSRLEVKDYRELRWQGGSLFVDASSTVLGKTPHFQSLINRGIADWAGELSTFSDFSLTGHHGIAVGDVDGDGRDDVFVCDGGGLPNRLYRQKADGSAEEVSAEAGLDWYEDSRSALFVDVDNDGDQDLVVGTIGMVAFAENDGSGRFTLRGGFPGAQYPFSMSAADYDLDGDVDLYICRYGKGDNDSGERGFEAQSPVPFEDARNGGANVLLENLGGFGFADVTEEVGLGVNNDRWSFAASWEDYDRDGDSDLYVANDFGMNTLYRNDGGRFKEVAEELGVEDVGAGMSVSWGDYNRDGRFDLYVGNMFSSAGGRITNQERFTTGRGEKAIEGMRRMAKGNSLFAGDENGFVEVANAGGAEMGRWSWSSGFIDVDSDGWEDLVVSNGYLTGWETKEDL